MKRLHLISRQCTIVFDAYKRFKKILDKFSEFGSLTLSSERENFKLSVVDYGNNQNRKNASNIFPKQYSFELY